MFPNTGRPDACCFARPVPNPVYGCRRGLTRIMTMRTTLPGHDRRRRIVLILVRTSSTRKNGMFHYSLNTDYQLRNTYFAVVIPSDDILGTWRMNEHLPVVSKYWSETCCSPTSSLARQPHACKQTTDADATLAATNTKPASVEPIDRCNRKPY
jgi:hypothetical protein